MDERMHEARRLAWGGIGVAVAIAAFVTMLWIGNAEHLDTGEVLGSVALGTFALLPTVLAWRSLDRRPGLLLPAAFAALVVSAVSFALWPLGLLVAITWLAAKRRLPAGDYRGWRSAVHRLSLVALTAAAFVVLFVHVDPECTETLADGTTRIVDPASKGLETGWAFSVPSTGSVTMTSGSEVVASFCTSDTIVVGEALASLAVSAAVISLAFRWPPDREDRRGAAAPDGAYPGASAAAG